MPRKVLKKTSARIVTKQIKNGPLKALTVVYLAIIFLPWQNINSFGPLISSTNAAIVQREPAAIAVAAATVVGTPVRLTIPGIKLNAAIESVGIKKDGSMDTPKLPKNTAWYMFGPKPGEVGNAVIAGHVNWWNNAVSAFANLNKIKVGDKIVVQDKNGVSTAFSVSKIKRFAAAANATDVFISNDGKSHLNLVTCIGVWNKKTRQYSQRLVIFADKIE